MGMLAKIHISNFSTMALNNISNFTWPKEYGSGHSDWKRSVFILIPKKGNARECSNYCTIVLISHTSKVTHKVVILQARLQQYMNQELPMFKLDLEKAEEPEIKVSTSTGASKKQENSRKISISASLTMLKPLTVWITKNGKILKEKGIPDHRT